MTAGLSGGGEEGGREVGPPCWGCHRTRLSPQFLPPAHPLSPLRNQTWKTHHTILQLLRFGRNNGFLIDLH